MSKSNASSWASCVYTIMTYVEVLYVDVSRHYYTMHFVVKDVDRRMRVWVLALGTRGVWSGMRVCPFHTHTHVFCMLHVRTSIRSALKKASLYVYVYPLASIRSD